MRSFMKIESSRNGELSLPFTSIGTKMCLFKAIREYEILPKISGFTVSGLLVKTTYHLLGHSFK